MVFSAQLVLFSVPMHQKNTFVTKPFRKWNKKARKLKNTSTLHIIGRPWSKLTILNELLSTYLQQSKPKLNIERNCEVLKSIARAVLFYGRQCIALRGDVENPDTPENPGNFLVLLKLLAVHNTVLKSH